MKSINIKYALAAIAITPLIPAAKEINYPIIFFTAFCLYAVYLMIESEKNSEKSSPRETVLIGIYIAAIALLTSWISQPSATLNGGLGWDGVQYAHLYEKFLFGSSNLPLQEPFHQRIGLPFLASKLPFEPQVSFYLLHSIFWLGAMALLALTCRNGFQIPHSLTILGLVWLQIHWIGIPRAGGSYKFIVDSASIFFTMALTYSFVTRKNELIFAAIAFTGAFFKESILLWCLCLAGGVILIKNTDERWRSGRAILLAIIASKFALLYSNQVVSIASNQGPLNTLMHWISIRAFQPFEYLRYFAAIFSAFGGFWCLLLLKSKDFFKDKNRNDALLPLMAAAAIYLWICFFAGSDLTKFALSSFPLTFPIVLSISAKYIDKSKRAWVLILATLTLPVTHFWELIPSPLKGHEIPNMDTSGLYAWMMEYAHPFVVSMWIAYCLMVLFLAVHVHKRIHPKNAAQSAND